MIETGDFLGFASSTTTKLMCYWALYERFLPYHLRVNVEKHANKLMGSVSNSVEIKFNEYNGEGLRRSEAYNSICNYLSTKSIDDARRLKASETSNMESLVFRMDDNEVVEDEFKGVKVKWCSSFTRSESKRDNDTEERYLTLSFNRKEREIIVKSYLSNVLRKGREIGLKNRERKLYTNSDSWERWSSVTFNHPATFETLAMDPEKKERIKKDLTKFIKSKDYYKKVGKPWKRGYLLFGPPGTGKSTMISAMANFLDYDVYDLELTSVGGNAELKRLILGTKGKSIIVIEDIDCMLAGKKRNTKEKEKTSEERVQSKVTLSGLLNAIDGLWSACSDEKIMVLTTNFVDKLDPALIRRGRMDNHIEMSYCRFEAFKVLAKNYLGIESHDLYEEIKFLIEVMDMSPADVAENLMPKSDDEDADICLKRLVKALEEHEYA